MDVQLHDESGLQTTWDATSLTTFSQCPHKYWLKQHQGWRMQSESADVEFGGLYGLGLEVFYKAVVEEKKSHDDAVRKAVRAMLIDSWDFDNNMPKSGLYLPVWRCSGSIPFKNEKGNRAKCPYSHKGKLFWTGFRPDPGICSCGSPTIAEEMWSPNHNLKDRIQAIKAFVWYTEEQKDTQFNIVALGFGPDGKERLTACVEMGWRIPIMELDGVLFHACGWFDTVKRLGQDQETYVCDFKSTKNQVGNAYFAQYDPNIQVNLYQYAGAKVMPPELGVVGVGIEAMQILKEGVRFAFRLFPSSVAKVTEFLHGDLLDILERAMYYHRKGVYPRNRSACYMCEFKPVCSAEPEAREHVLKERYVKRWWNPLKREQQETRP